MIKIRRVYFHKRHVDLLWYERKGVKMKIKRDCVDHSLGRFEIYDSRMDVVRKVFWVRNVYVTLE
jgi:hypothetical protein